MKRASEIVGNIYQKYLPKVKAVGITLDVDFPDTTLIIEDSERLEKDLEKSVKSAIARTKSGQIKIAIKNGKFTVSDTGLTLSKSTCDALSTEHIKVKSRVGFGTTITIK